MLEREMQEARMEQSSLELLAPAGGPEQLNAALAAGAHAIFCGFGHHFNARRGAISFDDESFAEACRRAHLVGARIYVTVNVVIKADEMARALALVRRAWLLGADAFIVQDWGLHSEIRRLWPQIETHVSTQANVHDARGVAWCRDRVGAARVTLSRELSLPEIARIAQEGVELEGFAHGALCFCYSGICQLSSTVGDRSANRGACAQPCRLPMQLLDEEGNSLTTEEVRPLCPKDLRTIDRLGELAQTGLASLKVEGRLKGSDYVYAVVRAYRSALDELAGSGSELDSSQRERLIRRAFNRGFTNAYLDGRSGSEMMSYERSNNRGELVGEVCATRDLGTTRVWKAGSNGGKEKMRKITRAEVDVLLSEPVGKGDLLEVRPEADPSQFLTTLVERDAQAGEVITCTTARPMPAGCTVRVIRSQAALDEGARAARADVPRPRDVRAHVIARLGKPFEVRMSCIDGTAEATARGFVVEPALSRAVTKEDLVAHVGRLGGSAFRAVDFEIELDDGCGMRFSDVHKVRAEACRRLVQLLLEPYETREARRVPPAAQLEREARARLGAPLDASAPVELCALVCDAAAARAARAAGATRIYATADALLAQDWGDEQPIPWLDEVCREIDHERLDPFVQQGRAVAVGNVSELSLAAERGAQAEVRPCIPVHNPHALAALVQAGAGAVWASAELSLPELLALAQASPVPVGLVAYGRTRAMTSEHCVLQVLGRCINDCARCTLRTRDLSLLNVHHERFPVRTDLQGRSRIYAHQPLDAAPEVADLLAGGVKRLMVDATLLSPEEAGQQVARLCAAIEAAREGKASPSRLAGHSSGHLHRPIE